MIAHGHIIDGSIVLEGDVSLPEGARVKILLDPATDGDPLASNAARVRLPLVPSEQPGTVVLDNQTVAELLDDDAPVA